MIHPINIEADLLSANPQRPQLIEPKKRARITYNGDGRRMRDGKPTTPCSPRGLWADSFLRAFTHRIAAYATAEAGETSSIDSFVDVVDLKPAEDRPLTQRNAIQEANRRASLLSSDEDVLAATVLQGPEATSPQRDLVRRTSTKATAEQLAPLRERCCSNVANGFKEFLRFDFANTELFKPTPTLLTPNSIGSRVWTRDNDEKPRSPLANALCFKIASVAAFAEQLAIRVDVQNPASRPVVLEDANNGGQLIRTDERQVEFPTGGPHSFEFLVEADERMRCVGHDPAAFLMITMLGRVVE